MTTIKVLFIPVEGDVELRDVEPKLDPLQILLNGGYLEVVTGPGWHAYMDEEGKLKGLDVNVRATKMLRELGWRVPDVACGPVMFMSMDDDGNDVDVPELVLDTAARLDIEVVR